MELAEEWLIYALFIFFLIYNLTWLVFLTKRHYGQVTTTAGHIFELNVLLNYTIFNFFMFLLVDLEVLPWSSVSEMIYTITYYSYLSALAGSHIETAIFLKTLSVNTMMTNSAGKIILALTTCSFVPAVINTLVFPSWKENQRKMEICEFLNPTSTVPTTVVLVIVLAVIGFSVFRSCQFRKVTTDNNNGEVEGSGNENEVKCGDALNDHSSHDRLFTIQAVISELINRESEKNNDTPFAKLEDDIVLEDIEVESSLANVEDNNAVVAFETTTSLDQLSISEMIQEMSQVHELNELQNYSTEEENNAVIAFETTTSSDKLSIIERIQDSAHELNELKNYSISTKTIKKEKVPQNYSTEDRMNNVQCLPGISIIQTIHKYSKNAIISLLILSCELPWYVSNLYGFFTDSGCENPTLRSMSTFSFYYMWIFYLVLPFLIKIKLDRLSE